MPLPLLENLLADLELMTLAAQEGGALARQYLVTGVKREANKTVGDPYVTAADRAIDQHLQRLLTTARPEYGWLSEESAHLPGQTAREFCFVVDPIDGTRAYCHIGREFAVSVGLLYQGQPLLGAIYRPVEHQLLTGGLGVGVFQDGRPSIRQTTTAKPRLVVGYREEKHGRFDQFTEQFQVEVHGSIAYRYGLVATGYAQAAVSFHELSLWDVAAGHALVRATGGELVTFRGDTVDYTTASPTLAPGLLCAPATALPRLLKQFQPG